MAETTINELAHCKMLLHAARYPHTAVNGILLAEDNRNKESKPLKFVDCVPLFHVSLGLSPMLEVALLQIDAYCKSKSLVIGGYYQANENYTDNELNHVAKTVGRRIQENFNDGLVFMIDNRRVRAESVSQAYRTHAYKESGWREIDRKSSTEDDIMKEECLYALLKSGAHRHVVDFDCHLDDVRKDWRNLDLNDLISRCT